MIIYLKIEYLPVLKSGCYFDTLGPSIDTFPYKTINLKQYKTNIEINVYKN